MEQSRKNYAGDAGTLDYKAKVLEIYPHAYCLKNNRHTFYVKNENGNFVQMVRYQFEIITDGKGNRISTSTYTEEGAWEYAWHYVEKEMLNILEM
jgi:hypothetical protein